MDLSRFRTPDWLIIGGGVAVLIFGLLDWFDTGDSGPSANAFQFTFTGLLPWLLIVAAAVLTFLLAGGVLKAGTAPWPLVILTLTAIGALLIVLRLIIGAEAGDLVAVPDGAEDFALDRAVPLYLAALGAVAAAAGAFLNFQTDANARTSRGR